MTGVLQTAGDKSCSKGAGGNGKQLISGLGVGEGASEAPSKRMDPVSVALRRGRGAREGRPDLGRTGSLWGKSGGGFRGPRHAEPRTAKRARTYSHQQEVSSRP